MMYRPVPTPIKPCQTSSRRAAGELPIGWNSSKTPSSNTKWRTWKSPHHEEDPVSSSKNNNSDDDDCKSTPTISTTADSPVSHHPRSPSPKNPSITGTSPKCVLLRDTPSPHVSSASVVANRQEDSQFHQPQEQQKPNQQSSSSSPSPQSALPAVNASDKVTTERHTIATTFRNDQDEAHHPPVTTTTSTPAASNRIKFCDGNSNPTMTVNSTHDEQAFASLQQNNDNTNPASSPLGNNDHDDDNDDDLDDIEKERRRQARALEQQQRILRQVQALRELKRNKNQNKHHQKAQPAHVLTRDEIASNPPSTEKSNPTAEPTTTAAATNRDNKSKVRSSHDYVDSHRHDHDATRAGSMRAVHRPDRPPRTKGLLYQRQANGSLVLIDRPNGRQSHLN
ncbi:hypothetical protein MHU86_25751 [Fragilaria crotonensis]|nr:hypothetical protein MHU86_25751 [Fragilaria crotonensis]